ncbi:squalene/phytoene synthase family protein [Cypionkella sp.]|uniref:squalene/phytoene synthase family protein n=1 Tax=Cypionkella sp. TaxID=2811411 RepID=UPI002AB8E221|nr:squalene/phytoene synthase family protein [Cypionkella sp.]MDZ4391626.1 squalene/phytoene synthase family protein [Cypionkella sp.]
MSLTACADLVERGDPDRFAAVMAAPAPLRARLWPLYAFNLEIARAPWVTKEPMIAEMRLQWWRDVVAEAAPRAHEVAGPLHDLIGAARLDLGVLDRIAAARIWDVYSEPFEDQAAFDLYLEETSAGLMWLAAQACGATDQAEETVRAYGWSAGLASYLRAVPSLEERGRRPLVDGRPGAVRDLAARGVEKISKARAGRHLVGKAAPALLAGWQAEGLLRQVLANPMVVAEGRMGLSEFGRRGRLLWQGFTGRW